LAEGENHPQGNSGCEQDARKPGLGVEEHEIEGHERETRRRM
jgi:hypothetical protein